MYRPSPLHRAYALEKFLDTPAHVYYKYEGNNSSGSHKLNSALPQAYYNRLEGNTSLTTETGGTVGDGAEHRVRLLQDSAHGLYGKRVLRAEAASQDYYAGVRR